MNRQNSPAPLIIIILAALVIFMVTSCKPENYKEPNSTNPNRYELNSTSEYSDRAYRTYTLEGCEYIVVGFGSSAWGSHKGNCKNLIHKNTQDGSN
jgi:hypothetical protein